MHETDECGVNGLSEQDSDDTGDPLERRIHALTELAVTLVSTGDHAGDDLSRQALELNDRPLHYFAGKAKEATKEAAKRCKKRRAPIPLLVRSVFVTERPEISAVEHANGDQITGDYRLVSSLQRVDSFDKVLI